MDEYFSGSKPNLVNKKIIYNIEKQLEVPKTDTTSSLYTFYEEYLSPNLLFITLIIIFIVFLYYRYKWRSKKKPKPTPPPIILEEELEPFDDTYTEQTDIYTGNYARVFT